MRFVMVAAGYPPLRSAGLETGCMRLAHALAYDGHPVHVLTQRAPNKPSYESEPNIFGEGASHNPRVHRVLNPIPLGPLWGLSYMAQVRHHLYKLSKDWDFVLCHKLGLHSVIVPEVARKLNRANATLLVNAGDFSDIGVLRKHRAGEWLLKRALTADAFFSLSGHMDEELAREGVSPDRIHRFRYMMADGFAPQSMRPPEHPSTQRPPFLFIGRFHRQKNIPLLVEAFEAVHASEPEARLLMVGKGDQDTAIRQLVSVSPAHHAIEIRDWTDDPASLYRQALAVVSSSDSEGLSNVSVEAASCGAPTILTDVSGVRELLELQGISAPAGGYVRGRGGLMVTRRDKSALSAAMLTLWRDERLREALSTEALQNARERFSRPICTQLFLHGVQAIVERRCGDRP